MDKVTEMESIMHQLRTAEARVAELEQAHSRFVDVVRDMAAHPPETVTVEWDVHALNRAFKGHNVTANNPMRISLRVSAISGWTETFRQRMEKHADTSTLQRSLEELKDAHQRLRTATARGKRLLDGAVLMATQGSTLRATTAAHRTGGRSALEATLFHILDEEPDEP